MRRNFCPACTFAANGVKTRIAIDHTCGLENKPWHERPRPATSIKKPGKAKDRL